MSLAISHTGEAYLDKVEADLSEITAVTTDEAKNFAKATNAPANEDLIFEILINSAQRAFEEFTHSFLYETTVTCQYSFEKGESEIQLPYQPVDSIMSVQRNGDDIDYDISGGWLTLGGGSPVEILYVCKRYDPADTIDAKIKLGLLKWIATNYNDRENTIVDTINEMPNGSKMLWEPYRYMIP